MLARGIGMLMDGKQWGMSDLAMEAIRNPKLVEIARDEAKELLDNDPILENYPDLAKLITDRATVHME
jgi:RecG-like helicase